MPQSSRKPRAFKVTENDDKRTAQGVDRKSKSSGQTGKKTATHRKPRAIKDTDKLTILSDNLANGMIESLTPEPLKPAKRRGIPWMKLLFAATAGLVSLGIGLALDQLIRDLFARNTWLGWIATALTAIIVLALFAVVVKEIWAISRLNKIDDLRRRAEKATNENDLRSAQLVVRELEVMFNDRSDTARARDLMREYRDNVLDGKDLVLLCERDLFGPLDRKATKLVLNSAKRVSLVTAISPRALVDIAYVMIDPRLKGGAG